jgi:homoserine O-acetyltransferase
MSQNSYFESISMTKESFHSHLPLPLESGELLPEFNLAYTTYGTLNADRSNVIWVIHALTGDSNAAEWWSGIIGEGKFFDPSSYFIICANLIGSCYGSTNPFSKNPKSSAPYYYDFPSLTTRDHAIALERLRIHLQLEQIDTLIGGSLGGQVGLEWAIILGDRLAHVVILASTAKSTPWVIGFNETQRMAIQSDCTWGQKDENAGKKGLQTARAIAMLSYRHPEDLTKKQSDSESKLDNFRAASYLRYQGEKLAKRFNALSYWNLSKSMDSHDLSRGRESLPAALGEIKARVLTVGVNSDLLFLASESQFIAKNVKNGSYQEINSLAGHDAFLIEFEQLSLILESFYKEN